MSDERRRPQVFSIPVGAPFLPTLADAILSGRVVPMQTSDPLALAEVTILLPTRRAVRSLREVLIDRLGDRGTILPKIQTIGDVDEEDHLLSPEVGTNFDRLVMPLSVSRLARHLTLTSLTLQWGRSVRREILGLSPDEPLLIPSSAADATKLAADLARLLDDLATAGIAFSAIDRLVPDDQTGYFALTLDFLKIVAEHWPRILTDMNRVDLAARRDQLIRREAARLEASTPGAPIIAAGSTGSIPSTARLLKAIAGLSNGAVILPGLDRLLDDASFASIGDPTEAGLAAFGHPQFGLGKLIADLGIAREDVEDLGDAPQSIEERTMLLSEAMRPAATTDHWVGFRHKAAAAETRESALSDVGLVVARNEQEEALAIAVAFREAIEKSGTIAALVTPDRDLARRVAVELGRWDLIVDDSAGVPLDGLPPGIFAKLIVEALLSDGDPVAILALLKHPLAAFGMSRAACRRAARSLEMALLRGNRISGSIARIRPALAAAREVATDPNARHVSAARRRLTTENWDEVDALLAAIEAALLPLETLFNQSTAISAAALAEGLFQALGAIALDDTGDDTRLWQGQAGAALQGLLEELIDQGRDLTFSPGEAPAFIATLMADIAVTQTGKIDPRIHIWGTLEARLQSVDFLVLGGLDEGVWPGETRTDPWLSRGMRMQVGLEPPERRIGLSAHDFAQGFAAPRVLVTRAEKRGGTPTVASRWIQRLTALLGEDTSKKLHQNGDRYLEIARRLERVPPEDVVPSPRPAPTPPISARPRRLSITEIETLIRDPYAIYARHVLHLEPLESLGVAPDYALRGTLIHDALGAFTEGWSDPYDASALAQLLDGGKRVLDQIIDFPDIHAVWSHRFRTIAQWFVAWERLRSDGIAQRNAEISGLYEFTAPGGIFRLRGRADRIDLRNDGGIDIFDFKTGAPPSARQVLTGLAPQLALEVAMARSGAFGKAFTGRSVSVLGWLALGQVERGEPLKSAVERGMTANELGDEALIRLTALIAAFDEVSRSYISRARPMFETRFESPYDHLARVREWALVESGSDSQ